MRKIISALLILSSVSILGQTTWSMAWANGIGSFVNEESYHSCIDVNGNLYVVGRATSTVDFDPGPGTFTVNGSNQGFLAKYSSSGALIWAKVMQDLGGQSFCQAVGVDGSGNVTISGYFSGTVDLDPSPTTLSVAAIGNSDMFITRFDINGSWLWSRVIGAPAQQVNPIELKINSLGDAIITGDYEGVVDFDAAPGNTVNLSSVVGSKDVFVLSYNSSGNFNWAIGFGGVSPDMGTCVSLDPANNVYVTGFFQGVADFDPAPGATVNITSQGAEDMFIAKYSSSGAYVWAGAISGSVKDQGYRLSYSPNGNVILGGFFQSTFVDADPSPSTYTLSKLGTAANDMFVGAYSASTGSLVWAKNSGGFGSIGIAPAGLCTDLQNNIYVTGFFDAYADFDLGAGTSTLTALTNAGSDVMISKYDSQGNLILARNIGGGTGPGNEAYAVHTHTNNDIYISGVIATAADFDINGPVYTPTINLGGGADIFFAKYSQCIAPTTPTLNLINPILCNGQTLTLTITGTLNSATNWVWSNVSCGTGSFATGTVVVVSPTVSTNYFVRGEGGCITPSSCASTSVTVNTLKSITGQVTFSGTPVLGEVVLYKNEGGFQKYDSLTKVNIDIAGNYSFTAYNPGSYLVQALPTATNLQVTYGSNAVNWKTATVINHSCVTTSSMNINVVPLVNIGQGPGMIAGKVVEGLKFGQKGQVVPGAPIKGAMVKAGRNPGGDIVAQGRTTPSGGYSFTALPLNAQGESYFIIVDITGLDTNGTYHKVLAIGTETFTNLDFVADSAKITPGQFVGIVERANNVTAVKVYPNPNNGMVYLESKDNKTITEVRIFDLTGREVYRRNEDENIHSVDIRHLPKGVYNMRISEDEGGSSVFRLIIQD